LAQIYAAEQKWSEAQKEYNIAAGLDPHDTTILAQTADFLMSQNQSAQAFERVQKYVSSNSNDASGHVILGALYLNSKNYTSAQSELEKAIQLDPSNVQAYLRLGKVFQELGQTDLALSRYQKALDLQPKFAPLATLVGNLYLSKGDLETARKYYAQALDSDPNFAVAIANTAWVDAQEGKNLDVALGMAQKAKSLQPALPSISDTLGWVMYKRGDYASAIPVLRECVQKSPDSAEYHYHLGMTLLASGQTSKGKEELTAALRLKLDSANASQARAALAQAN
jgi:Tfp pilus assembly protein PilF